MFRLTRNRRVALALFMLVGISACEQATGPDGDSLNARAALEDYKAIQSAFTTSGWQGFQALRGRTPLTASSTSSALRLLPALTDERGGRAFVVDFFNELRAVRSGTTLARKVISQVHLGKTLVYDPALDRWVIDPRRTGAPANGTRFIVYEVDANKRPIATREIGYADLIDEGSATGNVIALRFIVVQSGRTIVDYRAQTDLREETGKIGVQGYAQDDKGTKLSFTIDVTGKQVSGDTRIDADFNLKLAPNGFEATGEVRGVLENKGGDGTIKLTLTHAQNTLRVSVRENNKTLDGEINYNGKTFATISGPSAAPMVKGPGGQPLTDIELQMVGAIIKVTDDVFNLVEELVKPVEQLLLLGFVL